MSVWLPRVVGFHCCTRCDDSWPELISEMQLKARGSECAFMYQTKTSFASLSWGYRRVFKKLVVDLETAPMAFVNVHIIE
ncbi:hypothetical protein Tco_1243804 [Tanacetum coccineum]